MKSEFKLGGSLALAAVGASTAFGQYGFAYGEGYASSTYSTAGYGLYVTGSGGNYYFVGSYTFGNAGHYDTGSGGPYTGVSPFAPAVALTQGYSYAFATPTESFDEGDLEAENWVTISNLSAQTQTLIVDAFTYGYASAYDSDFDSYGQSYGQGEVYDVDAALFQASSGQVQVAGFGLGDFTDWADYSSSGVSESGFQFYGQMTNITLATFGELSEVYYIPIGPGNSDTFYTVSFENHVAIAITPGPAAVASFAFGLFGVLRRRKKP